MKRRTLPESAYDFYARDGRDGELGKTRDTLAEAQADARAMRAPLTSYQRPAIEVCWRVNERKVMRMLVERSRYETALRQIEGQTDRTRPWVNPRLIAATALRLAHPIGTVQKP